MSIDSHLTQKSNWAPSVHIGAEADAQVGAQLHIELKHLCTVSTEAVFWKKSADECLVRETPSMRASNTLWLKLHHTYESVSEQHVNFLVH